MTDKAQLSTEQSTHLGGCADVGRTEEPAIEAAFCIADLAQQLNALSWLSVQHILEQG